MANATANDHVWIGDLGGTHHVTHCKNALGNLRKADHRIDGVQSPTSSKAEITHTGDAGLYNGKVMGIGRENSGLYLIKENLPTAAISFLKENGETALWHLRLGHASTKSMQHISELKNKIQAREQDNCEFEATVKVVRLDNGTEFFNSQCNGLFASLGIIHQSSCPYTPQQNGVIEWKHRHILEVARALKFQSSIPRRFWEVENASVETDIDHAGSDEEHETATAAPINENHIHVVLEPVTEITDVQEPFLDTIEEAGTVEMHSQPASTKVETRKSSRQGRPSVWLKDYITTAKTHTNTAHSISNALSYDHLSPAYQSYLNIFSVLTEPQSFKEAAHDPRWIEAMDQKILYQIDVNNAFLQGDLYEEWNIKLTDALVGAGYQQSAYDHSPFTKQTTHDIVIILVYVDDILITGRNIFLVEESKSTLHNSFKVKDLGELRYFLGIEVMRSDKRMLLNQRKYAPELISSIGLAAVKLASTPIE
ncbi:uncharacterized protein LOC142171910 [Nicotiana tabacum]|uniref:Uncharacterized protein LOC142171910 n=1 Tax=Nicotiana tabacum TaxID=4097 RepID=A0AC58T3D4_TOBAC